MPYPMKIQPVDSSSVSTMKSNNNEPVVKPVAAKSRFKRLFERQFPSLSRTSSVEKQEPKDPSSNGSDFEPSSVCLAKMVQSFLEESTEQKPKCSRHRCNCFHGICTDSSDDESTDPSETLKSLVQCVTIAEKNLLSDAVKILEKNKICNCRDNNKDLNLRKMITEGLSILGYNVSICKSRWEKTLSYPAGEYEYIDVIIEGGERLLIDVDFRSEFQIARSTKRYRSFLQLLPFIFVGKADRVQKIVTILSEAAKQSLKKKGMHFPPWRKAEYMSSKWLSPYTRTPPTPTEAEIEIKNNEPCLITTKNFSGEFELIFAENGSKCEIIDSVGTGNGNGGEVEKIRVVVSPNSSLKKPQAIKPKSAQRGFKIVSGLDSILKEKP